MGVLKDIDIGSYAMKSQIHSFSMGTLQIFPISGGEKKEKSQKLSFGLLSLKWKHLVIFFV